MATVSKGRTFVSGETVTPAKLNELVDNATVTAIQTADIGDSQITLAKLASAVANALVPTGSVYAFARNTAPAGWISADGNTLGSASSGATNASADYEALFTLLWANGWTDANLPILTSAGASSTRGASAAADWAANKRLTLPNLTGIFARGSGGPHSIGGGGEAYSATFGAKQTDAMQGHQHAVTHNALYAVAGNVYQGGSGATLNAATIQVGNPTTDGANGTPRTAVETRPANIALLYCIKF